MNVAIRSFTEEVVIEHLYQFYMHYKLPIVSVGSGTGIIEYMTKKKHPEVEFICIDPNPGSFLKDKNIYMAPKYSYVSELLENENLVGACTLFINWCQPDLDYDYEAIQLLEPMGILSIYSFAYNYEMTQKRHSVAGSIKFINWLDTQTFYEVVHTSNLEYKYHDDMRQLDNFEIIWLNNPFFPTPTPDLDYIYLSQASPSEAGCIVS